jgi:hypothetical protein
MQKQYAQKTKFLLNLSHRKSKRRINIKERFSWIFITVTLYIHMMLISLLNISVLDYRIS